MPPLVNGLYPGKCCSVGLSFEHLCVCEKCVLSCVYKSQVSVYHYIFKESTEAST
jgi:hypothetical protein